jgi:hypothetical protein
MNAEKLSFQPPLRPSRGVHFPFQPASGWLGKGTDALRKISKSRGRSAAPKYPLAFLQRADLKELLISLYVSCVLSSLFDQLAITLCDDDQR